MFTPKSLITKRPKKVRLSFTEFSGGVNALVNSDIMSRKYATAAYNFSSESGALRHAKGISALNFFGMEIPPLPYAILKLYYYKRYDPDLKAYDDRLLAYCADKNLYAAKIHGGTGFEQVGAQFEEAPSGINYRLSGGDVIILCSEKDPMTVWDGKNPPYTVPTAPRISSMCVHYERLFATVDGEKSAIWFSDDLDPTNWDISLEEAGFIEIIDEKGSLQRAIKFADYIYIFRSYGISRLTAYAQQTEFSVIPLYVCSGKIYHDTVCVCGDRVLFLASDGIYRFDGLSAKKILGGIYPLLQNCDNSNAVSAYHDGCWYLACRMDYGEVSAEKNINNTLLRYDIATEAVSIIRGADISSLTVISAENISDLAVSVRGDLSCRAGMLCDENSLFGIPLKKCWITPRTDLSTPDRLKIIRELYINTERDIRVSVISESGIKSVDISGGKGVRQAKVNLRGREFMLVITSETAEACISKPLILADVL